MRKGFTLVELLIVIVIIGILSSAMMLSSGSATSTAEASTIISDLRSLKAATLMFYAASMDTTGFNQLDLTIDILKQFMDNPNKLSTGYVFTADTQRWYVGCDVSNKLTDVRKKLKEKAASVGLMGEQDATGADVYAGGASVVYMIAR